jgi:WD40 repeat protein
MSCAWFQVAYIEVQGRCVLAIATNLGIQLWSMNGDQLVFNFSLNSQSSYADEEDDDERFMKGVATCMDFLCVGCSNGNIVIFNCSGKGDWNNFPISYNIRTGHQIPISAMSSTDALLVTGNDTGTIMVHSLESNFRCVSTFPGCGSPCTCVCQSENLICAGFATGHLRLYRSDIKELVFEITAHTRAVTGMSLNHAHTELAVCSKDQYINVWSLPSFDSRETSDISLLYADCAENRICTGIAYLNDEQLCVAFYDEEELLVFKRLK